MPSKQSKMKKIPAAAKSAKQNIALAIPNLLTYARIAIIPAVCIALYSADEFYSRIVAGALFFLAAITDYFDGYLSRKMKITSEIGRFLDPIADKLLVGAVLIAMAQTKFATPLETFLAAVIISREIFVSGLREYLGGVSVKVPVSTLAKYKTATQLIAIGFLIFGRASPIYHNVAQDTVLYNIYASGVFLLAIAAFLTVITGWQYMRVALKHMDN